MFNKNRAGVAGGFVRGAGAGGLKKTLFGLSMAGGVYILFGNGCSALDGESEFGKVLLFTAGGIIKGSGRGRFLPGETDRLSSGCSIYTAGAIWRWGVDVI